MIEHRWIERVIAGIGATLDQAAAAGPEAGGRVDPRYVERVVDFIRTYADRCHHGKEEDILFEELKSRDLPPDIAATMQHLVDDHVWARDTTRRIVAINAAASDEAARGGGGGGGDGGAAAELLRLLGELAAFYPVHIKKEDDNFFRPAMALFSAEEQARMLDRFAEFDATLIHEKYRAVAAELQRGAPADSA